MWPSQKFASNSRSQSHREGTGRRRGRVDLFSGARNSGRYRAPRKLPSETVVTMRRAHTVDVERNISVPLSEAAPEL